MLALFAYQDGKCPCGCGLDSADTFSHEETGPSFVVSRLQCRARAALLESQRAFAEGKKEDPYAAARLWSVTTQKR